jgi:methionyl-tRNA formyltransferase
LRIVFAGTPEFAAQHLSGLLSAGINISVVVTQPDKPGKRGKRLVPSAVKLVAEANNLTVLQPKKVSVGDLAPYQPDLLIVVAYGQILRRDLLDLPTYGCINVHGSLLPRWRGAAPIQRAIEAGDKETGICIMQMDEGLDTGPILVTKKIAIGPQDTAGSMADKLAPLGISGLVEVIDQIGSESLQPEIQPPEGIYAKKINKGEARIDWRDSAEQIVNKVRAMNPDPICFTMCPHDSNEIRLKLYECSIVTSKDSGAPGEVMAVTVEGVTVSTGDGALNISRLQLPLGKGSILNGRDIQNSRTDILYPGVRLN